MSRVTLPQSPPRSPHPALRRVAVETSVGTMHLAAPPVVLSDGPRTLGPVPDIGEQSEAIRAEFAA